MMMNPIPKTKPWDVMAVGAHPDDVELFAGGTLALLAARGRRVGIVSLTRGESATRGSPEIREAESSQAASILKTVDGVTLDLGDGRIENSHANRQTLVRIIRQFRPRVLLTHADEDRHPDHRAAHNLVRDSGFLANVGGYEAEGERFAVSETVFFLGQETRERSRADWLVDISETFAVKRRAIEAYSTQFFSPDSDPNLPPTHIASESFWDATEAQDRSWGALIGARYAEAFIFHRPPHVNHAFIQLMAPAN